MEKKVINKTKRQPTEQEKIIANHVSGKRLKSKIYKKIYTIQQQKTNNLIKKWTNQNVHFSKDTEGLQVYEKMLNITNHQGNANENHNEISPRTCQNDHYQKDKK